MDKNNNIDTTNTMTITTLPTHLIGKSTWLSALAGGRKASATVLRAAYWRIDEHWRTTHTTKRDGNTVVIDAARVHYVHRGSIEFRLRNKPNQPWVRASDGDVIFIGAGIPHEGRICPGCEWATVNHARIQLKYKDKLCRFNEHVLVVRNAQSLGHLVERMTPALHRPTPHAAALERGLVLAFFADLFDRIEQHAIDDSPRFTDAQIQTLDRLMGESLLTQWITPSDLAHALSLSPNYFGKLFRSTFNTTPQEWLKRRRMHYAGNALRDSAQTIGQIAYSLRYNNLSYFGKHFRQVMGCSPREYRRRGNQAFSQ